MNSSNQSFENKLQNQENNTSSQSISSQSISNQHAHIDNQQDPSSSHSNIFHHLNSNIRPRLSRSEQIQNIFEESRSSNRSSSSRIQNQLKIRNQQNSSSDSSWRQNSNISQSSSSSNNNSFLQQQDIADIQRTIFDNQIEIFIKNRKWKILICLLLIICMVFLSMTKVSQIILPNQIQKQFQKLFFEQKNRYSKSLNNLQCWNIFKQMGCNLQKPQEQCKIYYECAQFGHKGSQKQGYIAQRDLLFASSGSIITVGIAFLLKLHINY